MSREHLPIELLSAHLDGETTPEERGRVEVHLAACAACRAELEDLRRIADASSRLDVPGIPEGLRDRIGTALARPRARRRAWIGAAASLAAVGLVATTWYLQGPPPVAEPPAPPAPKAESPAMPPSPPPPPRPRRAEVDAPAAKEAERTRRESQAPLRDVALERERVAAAPAPTSDEKGGVVGGVAGGVVGGVETPAAAPMARVSLAEPPCAGAEFVETSVDVAIDRAALEDALRRDGAMPQPESRKGALDVLVPRDRWPASRKTLADVGVLVDETKVAEVRGACIGVRIRFRAP